MAKKKAIAKPKLKHQHDPAYDWNEVCDWIQYKTSRRVRDWNGKFFGKYSKTKEALPYQDMWHWLVDQNDLTNDSYFYLALDDSLIDDDDVEHLFIREIFEVLRKSFPKPRERCIVMQLGDMIVS